MQKFLSQFKNKYIIAPLFMFLFFVFVLIFSLVTSRTKIVSESPIAPTNIPSQITPGQLPNNAKRTVVTQNILNNYTNAYGPGDYVFQGTRTYGKNAAIYVYLKRGLAVVVDSTTTRVYEQWEFHPMSLAQFKADYSQEILDFTIIPTLPDE